MIHALFLVLVRSVALEAREVSHLHNTLMPPPTPASIAKDKGLRQVGTFSKAFSWGRQPHLGPATSAAYLSQRIFYFLRLTAVEASLQHQKENRRVEKHLKPRVQPLFKLTNSDEEEDVTNASANILYKLWKNFAGVMRYYLTRLVRKPRRSTVQQDRYY